VGVLDDAIREHLELKRNRGADPTEVEQQAAEALGPARREPPPAPAMEPADVEAEGGVEPAPAEYTETEIQPAPAEYAEQEPPVAELPEDVPAAEPPTRLAEELVPPAEPQAEPGPPTEPFELEPEPAPPEPAEDEHREPQAEVTPLHPVEEEGEPDEVPADERLSDAGPLDFPGEKRQDKPLWFEQSPGRDLDFDD